MVRVLLTVAVALAVPATAGAATYTVNPTRIYLKKGRAKIEIALAKGKKSHDKRATIAKRDEARTNERAARVR